MNGRCHCTVKSFSYSSVTKLKEIKWFISQSEPVCEMICKVEDSIIIVVILLKAF